MTIHGAVRGLALACHPLPTAAVTIFALLLSLGPGGAGQVGPVVVAVLAGQLAIGWHNDLRDADRDRVVGRPDKPVARGQVSPGTVRAALGVALVVSGVLSAWSGGWAGLLLHLGLVVGSGLAYNAGMKATVWSWVPYAVAFGALPAYVWEATGRGTAPWWVITVGSLLGVGAHLLNVLPDLEQDRQTGIRGLPHRLGSRWSRRLAPLLLLTGSVLLTVGPAGPAPAWAWGVVGAAAVLAVPAAAARRGRVPFLAAVAIALLNVVALVLRGVDVVAPYCSV